MHISKIKIGRCFLTVIISIQMVFVPHIFASKGKKNSSFVADEARKQKNQIKKFHEFADKLESGDLASIPSKEFDAFHLTGQRLEILNKDKVTVYDLSRYDDSMPVVAFTEIGVHLNQKNNELSFAAIRGGEVVARHVLTDLDIVSVVRDNEIVTLIDRSGKMHIMDMAYIAKQLFQSPVPVFKDLWSRSEEFTGKVKANYITRGLEPFLKEELKNSNVVYMRDANGEPVLRAGDLVLREDGKLVGVFSRETTYEWIRRGTSILQWQAMVISPESISADAAAEILYELKEAGTEEEAYNIQEKMTAHERDALLAISKEQLLDLKDRFHQNKALSKRDFDQFTFDEWMTSFEEIQSNAVAQIKEEEESTQTPSEEIQALKKQLEQGDLGENWQALVAQLKADDLVLRKFKNPTLEKIRQAFKRKTFKKIAQIIGAASTTGIVAGIGYVALPNESVLAINWIYNNWFPEVLKDASYRITLLKSSAALMAFWPLSVMISKASMPTINYLSKLTKSVFPSRSGKLKDTYNRWKDTNTWQKIVGIGMRGYANLIYPYWNHIFKKLLKQPNFLTALEEGLNPFKKIDKDSDVGKRAGLEKSRHIGIMNPFKRGDKFELLSQRQIKLQSAIAEQGKRAEALAFLLGVWAVSDKEKIDPATLLSVSNGSIKSDELHEILSDPQKHRDWLLIRNGIFKQIQRLKLIGSGEDLSQVPPDKIAKYFKIAQQEADKIKSKNSQSKAAKMLWINFKKHMNTAKKGLLNLGKKEHAFLTNVIPSKFVADQTKKEFTLDHAMVVGLYGLVGERADLSHPEDLAAEEGGLLWTSGPHMYDMVTNTLAHFFIAGSQLTLVFQGTPKVVEDNYNPNENSRLAPYKRKQGIVKGTWDWAKNVANPVKSDLGGIMLKRLRKRWATIQAAITLAVVFRWALADQAPDVALRAWALYTIAAQWYFGWVWDPIHRGNHLEGEHFELMQEKLQKANLKISRALRDQGNPEDLEIGYQELTNLFKTNNNWAYKQLNDVYNFVGATKEFKDMANKPENALFVSRSKDFYGLVLNLKRQMESGTPGEVNKAKLQLREALSSETGLPSIELRKLNAQTLMEFAIANPPIYTTPSSISWWSTWFGAVGSTILAIPLSVLTFKEHALQWSNIGTWFLYSAGLYTAAYYALGKNPWKFYLSQVSKVKARTGKIASYVVPGFENRQRNACKQLFAK